MPGESITRRLERLAQFIEDKKIRDVTLRIDEVVELWRALGDPVRCKADAVTVAAMRLLILSGQREREVTDAEWSEFDLSEERWAIPAARFKKARAHLDYASS